MEDKKQSILDYSNKWLNFIKEWNFPNSNDSEWIIKESINNFKEYYNSELLEWRKSVTVAWENDGYPSVQWKWKWAILQDVSWREYIDWLWCYWMMNHWWWNPDVISAVQSQLLLNTMPSQELVDPLRWALSHLIADITPWDLKYSFFAASGTEANEWAIKLAMKYTGKSGFIVATKSFHWKTLWALSLMGQKEYRKWLWQLLVWPVYYVPFGDAEAVEKQLEICETMWVWIAAVMMEPIQWEGWAIVPQADFWPRIREATKKHWVLLIADEVQTWIWRTGKFWWVDNWWVVPDIMTMAKALWGGVMPISAFVSTEEIWQCMMYPNPFFHTNTNWGGSLACSAAIAAINVAIRDDYAWMAEVKGKYIIDRVEPLVKKYPEIYKEITGKWLLIAQHFQSSEIGYMVTSELFRNNVLAVWFPKNCAVSRIEPPIVITYNELDKSLDALEKSLETVSKLLKK